jgi:hypothetical protein
VQCSRKPRADTSGGVLPPRPLTDPDESRHEVERGGELAAAAKDRGIRYGRHDRARDQRTDARDGGDPPAGARSPMPSENLRLEVGNRRVDSRDLSDHYRQRGSGGAGQTRIVLIGDDRGQGADVSSPLRRDNAELGEEATQRIDEHGTLTHQEIAGAVHHERRVLRFGLDRHVSCARPRHRLADCLGIGPVILVPAHVGFNVPQRDEADVMAEVAQLTRPLMRSGAGLQPDEAGPRLAKNAIT